MAETVAQRRARLLAARKQTTDSDGAAEASTAAPTEAAPKATKPKEYTPVPNKLPAKVQQANKSAKPYQRHVLFALVTAFVIKLVSNGIQLPTAK